MPKTSIRQLESGLRAILSRSSSSSCFCCCYCRYNLRQVYRVDAYVYPSNEDIDRLHPRGRLSRRTTTHPFTINISRCRLQATRRTELAGKVNIIARRIRHTTWRFGCGNWATVELRWVFSYFFWPRQTTINFYARALDGSTFVSRMTAASGMRTQSDDRRNSLIASRHTEKVIS